MTIIVADDQMSLAIGKKGQNVRLAAKLVKWKIDIKGESESVGLNLAEAFFSNKPADTSVDFLTLLKEAKGFGEKMVAILFAQNVVNLDQVLEMGVKGLKELSGIGPKKAEALFEFANEHKPVEKPEATPEVKKPQPKQDDSLIYTAPSLTTDTGSLFDSAMAAAGAELEAAEAEQEAAENAAVADEESVSDEDEASEEASVEDEEQDPPVSDLPGVDPALVELLMNNGFQTIAELSVTPEEELLAIDGIEETSARQVLELAKIHMENFENA